MRQSVDFDRWADEFAAEWVRRNPQFVTVRQYFSGDEQDALDRRLASADPFGGVYGVLEARERATIAQRGLTELRRFESGDLSPEQQISAALLESRLRDAIVTSEFADHEFVFNQFLGLHIALVLFLTTMHPLRGRRDAENYLARLAQVAPRLDEGIAEAATAAGKGTIPPRFILERTLEQLDGMIAGAPAEHPLVKTFAERMSAAAGISSDEARRFADEAEREVRDRVVPALVRVRELLAGQVSRSTDAAGAWALPRGAEYYAARLASETGTSLSAEEIHATGLREVARIEREMDAILLELGYGHGDGSLAERVKAVNETLRFPTEPDARAAIVKMLEEILEDAERRSAAAFNRRPKAPVAIRREPAFSEKSAAAHYTPPAPDGSMPGIYWIP
ncbi:MAG: DUF885 domain-containing protein, partial [Candidatus Eremiobacteraeota bacterium]|nr:DUF885 domain-containing protein [Candidatus Eremiobacteraeota bacterium]